MPLWVRQGRCDLVKEDKIATACWHAFDVIGRLEKTVVDCPDPRALAEFYCRVLGMRVNEDIDGWVVIGSEPGVRQLAFQRVAEWLPPRWPDPAYPQELHLDIRVDDSDQAEQELLALGATRVPGEHETGFRVFTDPVPQIATGPGSHIGNVSAETPVHVARGAVLSQHLIKLGAKPHPGAAA
jgi:catechol 2,3-dioxygenase-like lactoylglutathione lyase family enzyme